MANRGLYLACSAWLMATTAPELADGANTPSVLFVSVDDLNDWIGVLRGHPQTQTPNMDRLAARGILFTNAHCSSPACNPSRAAVYSGQRPFRTGVWSNSSKKLSVQADRPLLPETFQQQGYRTAGTGKLLHGGGKVSGRVFQETFFPEQRWSPFSRAQTEYSAGELPSKGTDAPQHVARLPDGRAVILPLNRMPSDRKPHEPAGESFDWGPLDVEDDQMGDTQITDWALGQLRSGRTDPLFLAVGYYRPHIPLWAPKKYFEPFMGEIRLPPVAEDDLADLSSVGRRWALEPVTAGAHRTVLRFDQWQEAVRGYLACVHYVDAQIGRLLEGLDASQHSENTWVVLWSDHGWHLGEKEHWGKWTGWERSTRVPLIVVPPKLAAQEYAVGSRCDRPVNLIDLYPTLCELCQRVPPETLDGESLVPLLKNPKAQPLRASVTEFDRGNISVRLGSYRYVRYAEGDEELYEHRSDPHEWKNLLSSRIGTWVPEPLQSEQPDIIEDPVLILRQRAQELLDQRGSHHGISTE